MKAPPMTPKLLAEWMAWLRQDYVMPVDELAERRRLRRIQLINGNRKPRVKLLRV